MHTAIMELEKIHSSATVSSPSWPQIGVVHTRGPWSFEFTGSVFHSTQIKQTIFINT
jgi:hypothetical protein